MCSVAVQQWMDTMGPGVEGLAGVRLRAAGSYSWTLGFLVWGCPGKEKSAA